MYLLNKIWWYQKNHIEHTKLLVSFMRYSFDCSITLFITFHPELGSYLLRVSSDPALYSSYFWWRDYYTVRTHHETSRQVTTDLASLMTSRMLQAFCDLCQALHDPGREEERIQDLEAWWTGLGGCKSLPPVAKKVNFDKSFWAYRNRDRYD